MPLTPVDRLEILVLVDNATDMLSTTPAHSSKPNPRGLNRRGFKSLASKLPLLRGARPLLPRHRDARRQVRTVLFDTGPEDYAFERNVTRLGADLGVVEAIVLSHGHWDHAGAMLLALGMIRGTTGGKRRCRTTPTPTCSARAASSCRTATCARWRTCRPSPT